MRRYAAALMALVVVMTGVALATMHRTKVVYRVKTEKVPVIRTVRQVVPRYIRVDPSTTKTDTMNAKEFATIHPGMTAAQVLGRFGQSPGNVPSNGQDWWSAAEDGGKYVVYYNNTNADQKVTGKVYVGPKQAASIR